MLKNSFITFTFLLISLFVSNTTLANSGYAKLAGNVYVMDNNPAGNNIVAYGRYDNGALLKFGSIPTDGLGAGDNAVADALGAQESVILSKDKRFLYVVNAGSDTISTFRLSSKGIPVLIQVISSEGDFPVSLTTDGKFVYVVNGGSDGSIAGYRAGENGQLEYIDNSVRALGTGQVGIPEGFSRNFAPGDIAFDTLNRRLLIPLGGGLELGEGRLFTFTIDDNGVPSESLTEIPSAGRIPFSVDFTSNGTALVVDALGLDSGDPTQARSSVSSLNFTAGAELEFVNSVTLDAQASCWIRSAHTTNLAFTTNTTSGTISSLRTSRNGVVTVLDSAAASNIDLPTDFDLTSNDKFLYVIAAREGGVRGYSVNRSTGALTSLGLFLGLPTFDNDGFAPQGVAVR